MPARPLGHAVNAPAYRIDGAPAGAEAFYAAACDPRRSVVVEACAGAGKTWMLVSRILRALLDGAQPQQVLAITFTRKAAGEMRARLDEWLAAFADPTADDARRRQELQARGLSEAEAAAAAPLLGELQSRLLASARAVQVHTFHGWFAQLLAHAPLALLDRLQLPPGAELVEDTGPLRLELMRRFHRAVAADPALREVHAAMVRRHRRSALQQWLDNAWQRGTEVTFADAAGTLQGAVPPAAALWPECEGVDDPRALVARLPRRAALAALARRLGPLGGKAETAAAGLRDACDEPDPVAAFDKAWRALFTDKGEPRKLGKQVDPLTADVVQDLQHLHTMHTQQQAHDDHRRMVALSRVLLAEYAALKRQRGLADMADLERAALELLADGDAAGWVQERLDQRLRHLLIDEFQDTSPLQWHALHGWLQAYAGAAQAPAVFIVGDPKQSIYRFRRAEPRVFDAARRFVVQGLAGQVLECDHTRRNAPGVIAALNAVFEDAARSDGWTPFRAHTTGSDAQGRVLALAQVLRDEVPPRALRPDGWRDSLTMPRHEPEVQRRELEAGRVAAAVAALVAGEGVAPGEVMVLARRRVTLHAVADALARRRLPHVVPEDLDLAESPEALDLAALLDVLASPGHDLSLARALKSPLFGASDDDLLWLATQARQRRAPWRDVLLAQAPTPALQRAAALLARWQPLAATLPPHDLLDRVVHEGELPARLAAAVPPARRHAALHAVQAVLAAALDHDGGRYASVYGFVRALRAGRLRAAPAAPADAVQLLTVHGAKGLEARAVFIADADPTPRNPDRATLLVDWPVDAHAPRGVAFLRSESDVPPSLQALFDEENAAREREELNGLYVAMTRAREWLVFSSVQPHRSGLRRSWWQRVQALVAPWAPAPADAAAEPEAQVPVLPPLTRPPPAAAEGAAQDPAAARLGEAVHRALEWGGSAAAAEAAAQAFGVEPADVAGFVRRIVESPECARFFAPGPALRWAGNEVPLADAEGALRIDRLVQLEDTWWVLDFKLGARPGQVAAYAAQMARYVRAVQAVQPGEPVRGGFITGQGRFVEAGAPAGEFPPN